MLILLGTFAALAVLLAAVGLYGIVSGSIAERRREIGVRVALGATPRAIVWQVSGRDAASLPGELPDGRRRGLRPQPLHRLSPLRRLAADAPTYLGVALFLVAITLVASYLPARRAARTDPLEALRES